MADQRKVRNPHGSCAGRALLLIFILILFLALPRGLAAYSMLTHEQVVDLAWKDQIEPLLRQRFPKITDDELTEARAYAYGGCIIQDLGYYPFGSKDFSNLLHYVRSGDFVVALLRDADDIDGYAFALGALAHYVSDTDGHPAVNQAVAISFPKLERQYGKQVTYEDNHRAHIRTEFGFDVVQVAKGRFTSDSYRNFIGFQVSKPLLEHAFRETYGLELSDILSNPDLAIGTYRRSVSKVIPEMTRVALLTKHAELARESPDFDQRKFVYRLSRAQYEQEWGTQYQRPGWRTRLLASFIRVLPKVGPLRTLDITMPSPKTEDLYIKSVNQTVDAYCAQLAELRRDRRHFKLPNRELDTGELTRPNQYQLADETYAKLVQKLAEHQFASVTPELRANLLAYYSASGKTPPSHMPTADWQKLESALAELKTAGPGQ
jgi:hypothetical protein